MLVEIAGRHDASLWRVTRAGCPWTAGHPVRHPQSGVLPVEQGPRLRPPPARIDPDVVILVDRPISDPLNGRTMVDRAAGDLGDHPDRQRTLVDQRTQSVVDSLRAAGRRVVIVEPVPVAPEQLDPFRCITAARFLDECRFVTSTAPLAEEVFSRQLAEKYSDVWSLSLDDLVCPYLPICDPVVDGTVVRSDDEHLTAAFALGIGDVVDRFLVDNRVVE